MRSRSVQVLLTAVSLLWASPVALAVTLPPGPVDPTGEARKIALKELGQIQRRDPTWHGREDTSVVKRARLGEPFLSYWTDWSFTEFAESGSDSLLKYVTRYAIRFPMVVDNRVFGSIDVIPNHVPWNSRPGEGPYVAAGEAIGDVGRLIAEARRTVSLRPGERVSKLLIQMSGQFLVIEDGTRISRMARIPWDTSIVGEFLPVEHYLDSIRRDVAAYPRPVTDPANAIHPVDTLR